ncbi:hypothetical protein EWM64_g1460 [Hericium alpestre]|uniref:Uncharacterized protein n=1 Tax=Hericium alpestre TaxID=135208 RepID=A0A4Z0A8B6_9AGAM|nr:hypothetical protein EWM64_g1460 [Hericium alpestre]
MEGLEEIDFGDMGKMREEVEALAAVRRDSPATEQSNGNAQIAAVEEQFTGFYIDTQPSTKRGAEKIIVDRAVDVPLGELADEDDEVIVYVAPHPRTGKVKAAQPPQEPVAPISGTQAPVASASGTQSIEVEVVHGRMEMTVDPVTETAVVDPTEEAVDITMEIQAPAPASPSPAPAFADVSFSSLSTTPSTPRLRQYAAQPRSLRKQMHQGRITRADPAPQNISISEKNNVSHRRRHELTTHAQLQKLGSRAC